MSIESAIAWARRVHATCGLGTAAVAVVFVAAAAAKLSSLAAIAPDARPAAAALSVADVALATCLLNVRRVALARYLATCVIVVGTVFSLGGVSAFGRGWNCGCWGVLTESIGQWRHVISGAMLLTLGVDQQRSTEPG